MASEKKTFPRGFKHLQRRLDGKSSDQRPAYFLGDGFSDSEATPSRLVPVNGKRKYPESSAAFGQLELTSTTPTNPEKAQKRTKFMIVRKRVMKEHDPFDFADTALTARVTKRGLIKTTKDGEASETPTASQTKSLGCPVLGEVDEVNTGADAQISQAVQTQCPSSDDVKNEPSISPLLDCDGT